MLTPRQDGYYLLVRNELTKNITPEIVALYDKSVIERWTALLSLSELEFKNLNI